ncbi:MAG TPA: DUF1080 domain-containing protein [Gemmatimonadaceae bacterium]|nr:DUF1080 domain-containing protein [Gemmatimonadaceae bacterium]
MIRRFAAKSALIGATFTLSACYATVGGTQTARMNTLTPQEVADGWKLLFDGSTTSGWHNYKKTTVGSGWLIQNGILTRTGDTTVSAGDILTNDKYRNFDLALDWRISEGGNSGIIYRATEDNDYVWQSGAEMQILDDARHSDGKLALTSAGSDFAVYPAPRGVVHPAGEWNSARLVVKGNHVEHWLNGTKLFEYEIGSPDWLARVAASKFKSMPNYGKASEGYIALQDHGDKVEFRNIRIKALP